MMEALNGWATTNSDIAYLVGFIVIVALFYGFQPYQAGLNVATSKSIPFKSVDVFAQIVKPHRLALSFIAILIFVLFHFLIGAPLVALVLGAVPLVAMAATDYCQMGRENGPTK